MSEVSESLPPVQGINYGKVLLYSLLSFGLLIPLLSILYSLAIYNIPFVNWVSPIITLIFSALIALPVERGIVGTGQIRQASVIFLLCLAAGLWALLLSWLSWLSLVTQNGGLQLSLMFDFLKAPEETFGLVSEINKKGAWNVAFGSGSGKSAIEAKGLGLTVIWILEAMTILLLPLLSAYDRIKKIKSEQAA